MGLIQGLELKIGGLRYIPPKYDQYFTIYIQTMKIGSGVGAGQRSKGGGCF